MFASDSKRARRRGWPIMAYVGANGSGKTAAMVWDTKPTLDAGRPVLSTVRLLDTDDPRECDGCPICDNTGMPHLAAHPLWIPFTSWAQLLEAGGCDVLMDEVTGVASSRESMSMPAAVANALVQMRRRDVVVRWTAPSWARADKIIRECSQAVTHCRGMVPAKVSDDSGRQWRTRRLFRWSTYDAAVFDEFTDGKRQKLDKVLSDLHWGPKSGVFDMYDTYDAVLSIGTVTEGGTCYQCGGHRRRPACSCRDNVPSAPSAASLPRGRRALPLASES